MRKTALFLCAAAGFLASAALAGDKDAKPADPKAKSDSDRIVCHTLDQTGSRLGAARVCHTVGEWAEMKREAAQATNDIQYRSKQSGIGDSGISMAPSGKEN